MPKYYTDLKYWLNSNKNSIFALWVYKHSFTPYEIDKRFKDQCVYENCTADIVKLVEVIELDDGDYLLGVQSYNEVDNNFWKDVQYYKLSEIRLERKDKKCYTEGEFPVEE